MKVVEMSGTFVVDEKGYPLAMLWRNNHVIGFELKEFTLDKFTKLLESLTTINQK